MVSQITKKIEFGQVLEDIILEVNPKIVVETGTLRGKGSTRIIANALLQLDHVATFFTIEVNPSRWDEIKENTNRYLQNDKIDLKLICGLSVPRIMLPTLEEIEQMLLEKSCKFDAKRFYNDVNQDVPDDWLGVILRMYVPDVIFLDSAGHMGFIEFNYVMQYMSKHPFILILDDVSTIKHWKTVEVLKEDSCFEIINFTSRFCIAKYNPEI